MDRPSSTDRACRLLRAQLAARNLSAPELARRIGYPIEEVEAMLSGERPLRLDRLEVVLGELGTTPSEFFDRLYGEGESAEATVPAEDPEPPSADEETFPREEVEALVDEVHSLIHGVLRMADARERVDRDRSARRDEGEAEAEQAPGPADDPTVL